MSSENNNETFIESFDSNIEDEIALTTPPRPPRRRIKASKIICIIILVICTIVAAVCIYHIIESIISARKANETYGKIESDALGIINGTLTKDPTETGDAPSATPVWTRGERPKDTDEPTPDTDSSDRISDTEAREPDDVQPETDATSEPSSGLDSETAIEISPDASDTVDEPETETESDIVSETEKEPETTKPDVETVIPPSSTSSEIYQNMRNYLLSLQAQSPDLYGIVYIPIKYGGKDKTILYPFVLGDDNSYYLNRDIYGNDSKEGCVFADFANDRDPLNNQNLVLYGHNMFNGSMFGNLTYFLKNTVFHSKSTFIYVYTVDAIYVYEPIAAYVTDEYDDYTTTKFIKNGGIERFLYDVQKKSAVGSSGTLDKGYYFYSDDKAITLSTCYGGLHGRLAVHGLLVGVYK